MAESVPAQEPELISAELKRAREAIATWEKYRSTAMDTDRRLRALLADVQTRLQNSETENKKLRDEVIDRSAELERSRSERDHQLRLQHELSARLKQIQESFSEQERLHRNESHRAALLEHEFENARQSVSTAEAALQETRSALGDARFRVEQLRRELEIAELKTREQERYSREGLVREDTARAEFERLKQDQSMLAAALTLQRENNSELREKLAHAERDTEQALADRAELVRRGDTAFEQVNELKQKLGELVAETRLNEDHLRKEREEAIFNATRFEAELKIKIHEVDEIGIRSRQTDEARLTEIQNLRTEIADLEQALEIEKSSRAAALDENRRLTAQIDETAKTADGVSESLRIERDLALKTIAGLEAELASFKQRSHQLEQTHVENRVRLEGMETETGQLRSELRESVRNLELRAQSERALREELEQAHAMMAEQTRKIQLLNEKLEHQERQQLELRKSMETLRDSLRMTQAESGNIRTALSQNLEFTQQAEADRAQVLQELKQARQNSEKLRAELKEHAEKIKREEAAWTRKARESEGAANALWQELVSTERNAAGEAVPPS